jgi:indole-3-acetate monooxygenase
VITLDSIGVVGAAQYLEDLLYRLAGSSAIFQPLSLERCFRDTHTAAQHLQVQEGRWETTGRVLMGLEPGSPVL